MEAFFKSIQRESILEIKNEHLRGYYVHNWMVDKKLYGMFIITDEKMSVSQLYETFNANNLNRIASQSLRLSSKNNNICYVYCMDDVDLNEEEDDDINGIYDLMENDFEEAKEEYLVTIITLENIKIIHQSSYPAFHFTSINYNMLEKVVETNPIFYIDSFEKGFTPLKKNSSTKKYDIELFWEEDNKTFFSKNNEVFVNSKILKNI
tara:strand:+ start:370 stop:990 length:621 start_codon:yes stop_codon:yes gene_type:complete